MRKLPTSVLQRDCVGGMEAASDRKLDKLFFQSYHIVHALIEDCVARCGLRHDFGREGGVARTLVAETLARRIDDDASLFDRGPRSADCHADRTPQRSLDRQQCWTMPRQVPRPTARPRQLRSQRTEIGRTGNFRAKSPHQRRIARIAVDGENGLGGGNGRALTGPGLDVRPHNRTACYDEMVDAVAERERDGPSGDGWSRSSTRS